MLGRSPRIAELSAPPQRRGPHGRAWAFAIFVLVWLLPMAAWALEYRFLAPTKGADLPLSPLVLSVAEREFMAGLPEIKVGIPTPAPRPYESISADGEVSGISAEMLAALAQTFGLHIKPVVLPDWSSTLRAARERQIDLVMTLGVTAERLDYLAFTVGAMPLPGAVFARHGTSSDLSRARFVLERNFLAVDHVRRQYPDASILEVETTLDALRAVAANKADVYLGNLLTAGALLATQPVPGIEVQQLLSYGTGFYHFGVRKDWAPLATILNKGIQTLRHANSTALAALVDANLPGGNQLARPAAALELPPQQATILSQQPVWRLGAVRGLPMLNDVDAKGLHSGIAAEYAEQVGRRLGVAMPVVGFDNVASMLVALRAGQIDMVPFLTRTPERDKAYAFSKPYVAMPYMLVARSDGPLYWNLDSLRGKRLALALQHPVRELLASHYPDIQIVDAANGNDAMDKVVRREAEAAVEVKLFANLRINADSGATLRAVSDVSDLPAQFHMAVARDRAELMPLVDRALDDIPASERIRMLRRWVALDLQPGFAWRRYLPLLVTGLVALLAIAAGTAWWMRRLAREVAARRRSEDLLNDIATRVPGVAFRYVLNPDGGLRHNYFSPGARAFLGIDLDPHQTVLAALGPHLRPEHRAAAEAEQAASQRSGERFKITCAYQHPDGREVWLHAEAVKSLRPDGTPVWTGFVVDVSTERALQDQLARAARSRHLMLASASHELRAPAHTLSLALASLSTDNLDAVQRSAVRIARDSAQTLAQLLGDVLDAARFEHAPLKISPRDLDPRALLTECADAWRAVAQAKSLDFEVLLAPELPARIHHDPLRLKQVLTNLLSNAFKYTASGSVRLLAEPMPDERLRVQVTDTGAGLSAADQARLFQPFVTLDSAAQTAPEMGRSGLGLSICRRIATLMGGEIGLASQPGVGTQVTLLLPLRRGVLDPDCAGTAPVAPAHGRSVLVCDDDATSRLLMVHMLRQRGLATLDTGLAEDALALWRRGGIGAIVTDLDMPGMDGRALLRAVRADEAALTSANPEATLLRTVLVVCSGSTLDADSADLGQAQVADLADAVLLKPVDADTLAQTLASLGVTGDGAKPALS